MAHKRAYTAQVKTTRSFVDTPAHDVQHPATIAYATGFETGTMEGWAVTAGNALVGNQTTDFPTDVRRPYSTYVMGTVPKGGTTVSKDITGLTPGITYQASVWCKSGDGSLTYSVTLGVTGIGSAATAIPATAVVPGPWTQVFYTFTATAATHTLTMSTLITSSTGNASMKLDDVQVSRPAWVERVPDHSTTVNTVYPLDVDSGTVTLDETVMPYGQIEMNVAIPTGLDFATVAAAIDPDLTPRVILTATDTDLTSLGIVTRTFDMLLTGRTIDPADGSIDLSLATDDTILSAFALVASIPDRSFLAIQTSVKAIVQSVMGKAGITQQLDASSADADFTTLAAATNLMPNGGFERDTSGWTPGANNTLSRLAVNGSQYLYINPSSTTSADTYAACNPGLQPGQTYTISADYYMGGAQTGTLFTYARTIALVTTTASTPAAVTASTQPLPNVAGAGRISWTFTVPGNATASSLRLYQGATSNSASRMLFDNVLLVAGDGTDTNPAAKVPYFDGDTPSTSTYGYAWTGTAGASPSTRTPVFERSPDTLAWQPGDTAWTFLEPILNAVGLTMLCDEQRIWRIITPDYTPPGQVTIAVGSNLFEGATDAKSRDLSTVDGSPLYLDAAIVKYSWTDKNGVQQERIDAYAAPGSRGIAATFETNTAYPGPGAARYIVTKAIGRGRQFEAPAEVDFTVTPGQAVNLTFPYVDAQTGFASSVSWSLDEDVMSIQTRGLIQTPPTAWVFEAAGLSWAALPAGSSWANG